MQGIPHRLLELPPLSRCGKVDHVKTKVVEESITDTDLGVLGGQQVFIVTDVGLIVGPPTDYTLPIFRGIAPINVFRHIRSNIPGGSYAVSWLGSPDGL